MTNEPPNPTKYEYWKGVRDSIIEWYRLADSKAQGVITVNGILLSFVGLAVILGLEPSDKSTGVGTFFNYINLLFALFVFTVCLSVYHAVLGVARGFNKPWRNAGDTLLTHYVDIASIGNTSDCGDRTHPDFKNTENKNQVEQTRLENLAKKIFDERIKKYETTDEAVLRDIAVNIATLSYHLNEKMKLIRRSFYITLISIVILGIIVILVIVAKAVTNPT